MWIIENIWIFIKDSLDAIFLFFKSLKFVWIIRLKLSDIFMVLLTATYTITTWLILKSSNKNFAEKIRPKIYFDFDFDFQNKVSYINIVNVGLRSAKDITINFAPDIRYLDDKRSFNETPFLKKLCFLSPSGRIRSCIGLADEVIQKNKDKNITVKIQYYDEKNKKYDEQHIFRLGSYEGIIYTEKSGKKTIRDIWGILNKINDSIINLKQK